jgi:hypothetical protein
MSARDAQFRTLYRDLRITDQQEFYQSRSEEYADAHRQAITVRYVLLLLSAAAGIAGQLVAGTGRAGLSVIAAVLAALAGAVTAYETLIGFPKLKKLYEDAALNLSAARIDLDAIEPDGDVTAEVERVETIFRTENGQWGQLVAESAAKGTPAAGKTSIKLRMLAISAVAA